MERLDREQKTFYTLRAQARDRATDRLLEPESEFIIKVQDINDSEPRFLHGPYIGSVAELSPTGGRQAGEGGAQEEGGTTVGGDCWGDGRRDQTEGPSRKSGVPMSLILTWTQHNCFPKGRYLTSATCRGTTSQEPVTVGHCVIQ